MGNRSPNYTTRGRRTMALLNFALGERLTMPGVASKGRQGCGEQPQSADPGPETQKPETPDPDPNPRTPGPETRNRTPEPYI